MRRFVPLLLTMVLTVAPVKAQFAVPTPAPPSASWDDRECEHGFTVQSGRDCPS